MSDRKSYTPGPARGAEVRQDGDRWTLVVVRDFPHAPEHVWSALTEPDQLRQWAPFDTDRGLGTTGAAARLTTVGAPQAHVTDTIVTHAEAPRLLEYSWGGNDLRWQLEAIRTGTRLTLWHNIDRRYIAMGAAGWHICLDVLDRALSRDPIGRIVGPDAMQVDGWPQLHQGYVALLGVPAPGSAS